MNMYFLPWIFSSFVGLIILWSTPIIRNYKIFRIVNVVLIVSNLIGLFNTIGGYYAGSIQYSFIVFFVLSMLSLFIRSKSLFKNTINDTNDSASNTKSTKRGKLWAWFFSILATTVIGMAAYLIDLNSPSDLDVYTDTNESANMILIGVFLVNLLLGIGARFSYLKYSRINQADLIADAIKTQVQTSGASTSSTAAPAKTQDAEERLRKLESLLTNGLISHEEYGQKKKEIIDSI
jgi:hypothetical protein